MALLIPLDPTKFDPNTTQPRDMKYTQFRKLNVASYWCVDHLKEQTERLISYLNEADAFPADRDKIIMKIHLQLFTLRKKIFTSIKFLIKVGIILF